ncbi:sensor histidine kinase [Paenibacillus oralis]|uniref:histidine kinase n=1 Tax=Paenibacillus oralis TaxID=2490856 RepID=A0A3P3U7C7_9BACL|nr:HAMP domain-containing histidine kinase [Paenibacillus oralis]RRJ66277.1 sensor histidine kinase [Paenibacillus oralis]
MRLFIREQRPLIVVYVLQLIVITLVYWLDGYRHLTISLYAALLSTCLLAAYLVFRYLTNRTFYRRLEEPRGAIRGFGEVEPGSPLSDSLQQLLKTQYRFYLAEISEQQSKIDGHLHFINQWVHQMKTPLSVIHLMVQNDDDPKAVAIGDEVDRLRKGLEMVLYTARLDTFEHDFLVETLDLEQLVRSVVSAQKRLFIRRKVFPVIELEETLTIASDEKWLSFVLTQIVTNAVRYTTGENGKIRFRAFAREREVVLEIADEGVGIPESDLPRVFDAYFTGENGRSFQESTGMGLYLVKQICGKLGHRVELESQAGHGTTVRIVFSGVF